MGLSSGPEAKGRVESMAEAGVVIACYTEKRWRSLCAAIRSALGQTVDCHVIVSVDHNEGLLRRIASEFPQVTLVLNDDARGASGTRNAGARASREEYLAFLDDDAVAAPNWVGLLLEALRTTPVVGVGGAVELAWLSGRPRWYSRELCWVVGESFPDDGRLELVRNVWAVSLLTRRADFWRVGGFSDDFGKVGGARQPEDTDLCVRMSVAHGGLPWGHVPAPVVRHEVPAD